jgi:hypothetical protein
VADDDRTPTLAEMSEEELHALIDRCRSEERRTRDAGRKQAWVNVRHGAEAELARRSAGRSSPRPG